MPSGKRGPRGGYGLGKEGDAEEEQIRSEAGEKEDKQQLPKTPEQLDG